MQQYKGMFEVLLDWSEAFRWLVSELFPWLHRVTKQSHYHTLRMKAACVTMAMWTSLTTPKSSYWHKRPYYFQPFFLSSLHPVFSSSGMIFNEQDQEVRDTGYHKHAFNVLISNRLGFHRDLPDTRDDRRVTGRQRVAYIWVYWLREREQLTPTQHFASHHEGQR